MADRMTPHQRAAYDRARVVPGGGAVAGGLQSDPKKQTDLARKMQPGDA